MMVENAGDDRLPAGEHLVMAEIRHPIPRRLPQGSAPRRIVAERDDRFPQRRAVAIGHQQAAAVMLDHFGRRSEEHTSELQSLMRISYAVFCLKKKKKQKG